MSKQLQDTAPQRPTFFANCIFSESPSLLAVQQFSTAGPGKPFCKDFVVYIYIYIYIILLYIQIWNNVLVLKGTCQPFKQSICCVEVQATSFAFKTADPTENRSQCFWQNQSLTCSIQIGLERQGHVIPESIKAALAKFARALPSLEMRQAAWWPAWQAH